MKKESRLEIESFLIASTAASISFLLAFICSWGIPLSSAIKAGKASKRENRNFFDVYNVEYNNLVYKMAQIPLNTYVKYKDMVNMCNKKYER